MRLNGKLVVTAAGTIRNITAGMQTIAFTGAGLNDATTAGGFSGTDSGLVTYTVIVSTAAGTDKFRWKKNDGALSSEVSMTGSAQALSDGITITFAATTGHTAADQWVITVRGLTSVQCSRIKLSPLPANTGKIYIGTSAMVVSTGVGVLGYIPIPGTNAVVPYEIVGPMAIAPLEARDYWIDAQVSGEGVYVHSE